MAIESILIAAVVIGGTIAVMLTTKGSKGSDTSPASLDSFQVTQIQEGAVVPMLWGKCRITTTLIWYGNLDSEEAEAETSGGKGIMTGGGAVAGYDYFLDMWHILCKGPDVTLHSVYIQDKLCDLSKLGTYDFNDGADSSYPTEPGEFAAPLTGVAHLFLDQYALGANSTSVPTFHFVVSRTSSAPLTYANMTNGVNPAAIIYDLLIEAGVSTGDIDLASFQTAADYWYSKGYGLNLVINKQGELREWINNVFQYVEGVLSIDSENHFVLKAYRDTDTYVRAIVTNEFKRFQFRRRTYDDVWSDFRGRFTDEDKDFTERALRMINPAVAALQTRKEQKTFNLTAFRDAVTASKRLWELMKRFSYPEAQITATVGIKHSTLTVGDIVRITHSDYGISDADYRVTEISFEEIDSNEIKLEMTQMLETLFDDNYALAGSSSWTIESYAPEALDYQRAFELPYTEHYGFSPAYLLLAARAGQEAGFTALLSSTGSDYTVYSDHTTFSQRGTLGETYVATTQSIDDDVGILYTPSRDDPEFSTLARADLFSRLRFAVIDDEIIAFQTVTPEGANSYRLTGCIRGILNTAIEAHTSGSEIWLTTLGDNVLENVLGGDFYLKLLPFFGTEILDAGSATAINVTSAASAKKPWGQAKIQVVRSGSTNNVTIWPTTKLAQGAGVLPGSLQFDSDPPAIEGTFEYYTSLSATVVSEDSNTWIISESLAFTLYVRSVYNGAAGDWETLVVSASDGTYVGPAA